MEKYYVPTINEFYDGFKFEENRHGQPKNDAEIIEYRNAWYKETFKCDLHGIDLYTIKQEIENNNIRVKYLDDADLKQIGFKHIKGLSDISQSYSMDNGRYFIHLNCTRLSTRCVIKIETSVKENSGRTLVVHSIAIKNKNELVKLMQQLNIYELGN
jgi:uncharacterized lipoprotein YehR (DUF1307 family)